MREEYLLIIDGSSLLSTQFYGNLPREILFAKTTEEKEKYFYKIMQTSKNVYTNAVYGFLKSLFKLIRDEAPTHICVTWDLTRETFRRKMYPPYKANRSETLVPLKDQFCLMQSVLSRMGVRQFMSEEFEADDFSGSLARKFENSIPVKIMTKDHDYLQLVSEKTHLWLLQTTQEKADELFTKYGVAKSEEEKIPDYAFEFNPVLVEKEFHVPPEGIAPLKGLQGDSSDNIPGVKGVGPESAWKLIAKYHTVEALYDALADLDKEKEKALKEAWKTELGLSRSPLSFLLKEGDEEVTEENQGLGLSGKASALLSEKLATIKTDIEILEELSDLALNIDLAETKKVLSELEITSLKPEFAAQKKEVSVIEPMVLSDFSDVLLLGQELSKRTAVGIAYVEDDGLYITDETKKVYQISESGFWNREAIVDFLKSLLPSGVKLYSTEGKKLYKLLSVPTRDLSIGAYLLDPLRTDFSVEYLSMTYGTETISLSEPWAPSYVAMDVAPAIESSLASKGMMSLYENVELKTMISLADMEKAGILVEKESLKAFSKEITAQIETLKAEIFDLSGSEFNLNSPKQLSDVLFTKLAIPYPVRSKKISTSVEILEKLKDDYPIVSKILQYRTYEKLRSTYADGLQEYISEDGRIYGTFLQTQTSTGRISSQNPNLQNIPVREALGREIRKLFIPKPGCVFIDADYSQIELRIMAHISGDETMISSYNSGKDIHRETAAKVFGLAPEDVTPELRSRAKAVNFGIIYGISAFSLSDDIHVSKEEAQKYIDDYFRAFPGVKSYLDRVKQEAYDNLAVKTMYGRIRPIPELSSQNFHDRMFGERVAMNSPIQGTAADIMKIAVNRVHDRLLSEKLEAKIVLQVHDEIILEVPEAECEKAEEILVYEMEHAASLSVQLKSEAKRGYSWYETK